MRKASSTKPQAHHRVGPFCNAEVRATSPSLLAFWTCRRPQLDAIVLWPPVSLVEREKLDVIIENQFVLHAYAADSTLNAITIPHLSPKTRMHKGRPCVRQPGQAMRRHHGIGTVRTTARAILEGLQLGSLNFTCGLSCQPSPTTRCHRPLQQGLRVAKPMLPT